MTTQLINRHGALESSKQALVNDLKTVVGDADNLLKEVANSTVQEYALARSRIEARLGEARASLSDARDVLGERARFAADATHQYVSENPWKTIGIMAGVGAIIGFLATRR